MEGTGEILVHVDGVGKRYASRRYHGSLRDALPAVARRLARFPTQERPTGATWVLRDVSFTVRRGEALGIIGHNGAGKSTILKLLAGVTAPTVGKVRVRGRSAALIELGAGFHPDLTGRENVYLNGSILGLRRAEIDRKLESIVEFAGLAPYIDTPVKYYSTGMHARLGFSVAAHVEPDVLLIDEVLSVGDHAFQQKCMLRMEEFRRSGIAIVFVSHNLHAVSTLCSAAILITSGSVAVEGAPVEVIGAYTSMSYDAGAAVDTRRLGVDDHGRAARDMEIAAVRMLDSDGHPAQAFMGGETATIALRARAHRDVREPVVSINVRNAEGVIVYATSTSSLNVSIGDAAAGEWIALSFALTMHLRPGVYSVHAGILTADGTALDWREHAALFQVSGDRSASGIADLRASVHLERIGSGRTAETAGPAAAASTRRP